MNGKRTKAAPSAACSSLCFGCERHSRGHLVAVHGLEVRGIDLNSGVRPKPLQHIRNQVSETIDRLQIWPVAQHLEKVGLERLCPKSLASVDIEEADPQ